MTAVYFWCTGQDDNLGDIVLRRRLLRAITSADATVDVYVGSASPGFVEAMGFTTQTVTPDRLRWTLALCASALRGRTVLVHNAGEIQLDHKTVQAQLALLVPQLLVRLRGGHVIRVGCAVAARPGRTAHLAGLLVRLSSRLTTIARWRDTESHSHFGKCAVAPDWAFDEGEPAPGHRNSLVIVLRPDRPALPDKVIHEIQRFAESHGLAIRTLVQVRRDRQAMASLAQQMGGDLVDWPDARTHAEQEHVVRAEFCRAQMVISDRIHALIIGAAEGATPAAVMAYPDRKVRRHFGAAGLDDIVLDGEKLSENNIQPFLTSVLGRSDELSKRVFSARSRVRQLDALIADAIGNVR